MKKIFATIFSAVALCMAMTSCDGYNDKELEDVVIYEPLQSVEMMVGSTTQVASGNWVIDDTRVVKIDGTTVTAVKSGVAVLNDVTSTPTRWSPSLCSRVRKTTQLASRRLFPPVCGQPPTIRLSSSNQKKWMV